MANKIIIIIINKKERKPVAKDKYTTRRERLVGYGRVRGVSRVSESQEIFFRAADNEGNPKLYSSHWLEKQELEKVSFEK